MSNTRDTGFLRNAIQVTDQGVTFVSGSTTLMSISSSGAVTTTGVISGSNALSASFSLNSALLNGIGSVGFATTGSLLEVSSSQQQISSSQQQISASLLNVVANYATTGSNSFRANQSITGSLVVSSTITAQTLVVQTVTSSIVYSSGSNIFGSALGDRQTFTGSVNITGSLTGTNATFTSGLINGTTDAFFDLNRSASGNASRVRFQTTGSDEFEIGLKGGVAGFHITKGDATELVTVLTSGNVGVNTVTPIAKFEVNGYGTANSIMTYVAAKFYGAGTGGVNIGTDGTVAMIATDSSDADMQFLTRVAGVFSPRVTIKSGGSVGIGTTDPLTTLSVKGAGANGILLDQDANSVNASSRLFFKMSTQTYTILADNNGLNFMSGATAGSSSGDVKITMNSAGSVGIGTTTPAFTLDVSGTGRFTSTISSTTSTTGATIKLGGFTNYGTIQDANDVRRIWFENVGSYRTIFDLPTSGTSFAFRTNDGTSILSLTSAGDATFNGTIQTTGMTVARNVVGDPADLRVRNNNTGGYPSSIAWSIYGYAVSAGYFDQFRIQASYPGYGLTNFLVKYQPNSSEVAAIQIRGEGYVRVNGPVSGMDGSSANFQVNGFSRMGQIIMHNPSNTAQAVSLNCSGADTFYINGALSKNSGSFRIRHPLASKKSTHQLVHSFIEGPKADLIYRGKIRLAAGRATVNMDEAATMTEGTFEALCREVQCFTSNESGWDLTKGTVEGNILTIESQNTESTEEISWLVIGERHDEHMMNTDWTDSNGRVIVEPLAPEENNIF